MSKRAPKRAIVLEPGKMGESLRNHKALAKVILAFVEVKMTQIYTFNTDTLLMQIALAVRKIESLSSSRHRNCTVSKLSKQ